ncbi:MAG TPA: S9 family peptidase [Parafilimonas sp.]|nr:S9 family peptidase [Parafilimonas sp.]
MKISVLTLLSFFIAQNIHSQTMLLSHYQALTAPKAPKKQHLMEQHGDVRDDEYYWLGTRDSDAVIKYLNDENNYCSQVLKPAEKLQKTLYDEMLGRIKQDDNTVPYLKNGYYYYTRYETGKQYPIFCRKKGSETAPEEILVDANTEAKGHAYCVVTGINVSPNNRYLVYSVDTSGRYLYKAFVKDLETGKLLEENFPSAFGNTVWANDSKTIFYDTKDAVSLRTNKVWRHTLGTPVTGDGLVYEEKDETAYASISKSKSEKYIFIASGYTQTYETQFIDADHPENKPIVIAPREKNFYYEVEAFGDSFYIKTNYQNAPNFKLVSVAVNNFSRENWKDVIPHRDDVLLQSFDVFKDYLVLNERINGISKVRIIGWHNRADKYITFDEPTYVSSLDYNPQLNTDIVRVNYSSMITPTSVIDYNMRTHEKKIRKVQPVIGYDKEQYTSEYLWATARDGSKIPVSVMYKKSALKDGNNPCLLYAYGSYGVSSDPYFNSNILSLVDRGFVYAIAHVRGGMEMGFKWYEDGKMMHKINTFTDFIDAAEYLVANKYTNPDKLFANGGSAGGLLMGAIANMRPDLFKGILADVPFVDVITTMSDPSIPLTTGEYSEWGNPSNKEEYFYMKQYSPYDNVAKKDYTNMLITTSYSDSQVQYFEPSKFTAKIRELKTDHNLLLLYCNMHGAHGGSSGRFDKLHDIARKYAFVLGLLE